MNERPIRILLVEDNAGDARLTREALKQIKVPVAVHVAVNGIQALDFLYRRGEYKESPRPDLVLLDLNLPKKDSREVLEDIKGHPSLRSIPVVVLSTSTSPTDINRSYELHANSYISKPMDLEGFLEVVQGIEKYWLTVVKYPQELNA